MKFALCQYLCILLLLGSALSAPARPEPRIPKRDFGLDTSVREATRLKLHNIGTFGVPSPRTEWNNLVSRLLTVNELDRLKRRHERAHRLNEEAKDVHEQAQAEHGHAANTHRALANLFPLGSTDHRLHKVAYQRHEAVARRHGERAAHHQTQAIDHLITSWTADHTSLYGKQEKEDLRRSMMYAQNTKGPAAGSHAVANESRTHGQNALNYYQVGNAAHALTAETERLKSLAPSRERRIRYH